MKNIVFALGLIISLSTIGNSAAAEDEIISIRADGKARVEFQPCTWCREKTREKEADKAKMEAYTKAIEDAKMNVFKQCAKISIKRAVNYSIKEDWSSKWDETFGSCDRLQKVGTKLQAFACKAHVKANCILIANDPRMPDQQAADAKDLGAKQDSAEAPASDSGCSQIQATAQPAR